MFENTGGFAAGSFRTRNSCIKFDVAVFLEAESINSDYLLLVSVTYNGGFSGLSFLWMRDESIVMQIWTPNPLGVHILRN